MDASLRSRIARASDPPSKPTPSRATLRNSTARLNLRLRREAMTRADRERNQFSHAPDSTMATSRRNDDTAGHSCFNVAMSDTAERMEKLETNFAHLERQYDELNKVVIEQGRLLMRLQRDYVKTSDAVQTMELERIRSNNTKPPHYQ